MDLNFSHAAIALIGALTPLYFLWTKGRKPPAIEPSHAPDEMQLRVWAKEANYRRERRRAAVIYPKKKDQSEP